MSKALYIRIPQPCRENWQNMTPKEQGRYCGSCEKIVIDFTRMSDNELLNFFTKAAGQPVCGHFANDQLNRKIKPATTNNRFSLAYVWNLLLATALFFESCVDGKINVMALQAPAVHRATEEHSLDNVAIVADTTEAIPGEVNGEECSKVFGAPLTEMVTSGYTVTLDAPVLTDHRSGPMWLKQNIFNNEK
ncbi:MAG TPA: hypothetical protein VIM79_25750 [Niastella sp.]